VERDLVKRQLKNGINVHILPTEKFKTTLIKVFIHQDLGKELVTKTSLVPLVLKRGCNRFPTAQKIRMYFEELYGADFDADVLKKGERHILVFETDLVNEKFIGGKNDILRNGLLALREIMVDPLVENGGFKEEYVVQEKDVLKREILSLFNNKMQYAIERCIQEMCKDEDYSLFRYGKIEDLDSIDKISLYKYYLEMIKTNPIDIYIMGDVDPDRDFPIIEEAFSYDRGQCKVLKQTFVNKEVLKEKTVFEKQNVEQGKLSLGLRTYTTYSDDDYYPLLMANGILGGGPHSKLFQNVREKASLAYYAFSRIEKTKGLMLITSGIEIGNYDRALEIILQQIQDLKNGRITEYEIESTRKMLINSFRETSDNPSATINLYLDGIINNRNETIDDMIKQVKEVDKEEIVEVSQKIKLDTIYFLTNNKD
jgi:predicted Zn-dependent peptidase